MPSTSPLAFPATLQAPGTTGTPFEIVAGLGDLPEGTMLRISRGDLDVLLIHSEFGIAAIEDRCPHMAAPLSVGRLEGCVLHCPLHRGSFDLRSGEVVTFPTTGGLDATPRRRRGPSRACGACATSRYASATAASRWRCPDDGAACARPAAQGGVMQGDGRSVP